MAATCLPRCAATGARPTTGSTCPPASIPTAMPCRCCRRRYGNACRRTTTAWPNWPRRHAARPTRCRSPARRPRSARCRRCCARDGSASPRWGTANTRRRSPPRGTPWCCWTKRTSTGLIWPTRSIIWSSSTPTTRPRACCPPPRCCAGMARWRRATARCWSTKPLSIACPAAPSPRTVASPGWWCCARSASSTGWPASAAASCWHSRRCSTR